MKNEYEKRKDKHKNTKQAARGQYLFANELLFLHNSFERQNFFFFCQYMYGVGGHDVFEFNDTSIPMIYSTPDLIQNKI